MKTKTVELTSAHELVRFLTLMQEENEAKRQRLMASKLAARHVALTEEPEPEEDEDPKDGAAKKSSGKADMSKVAAKADDATKAAHDEDEEKPAGKKGIPADGSLPGAEKLKASDLNAGEQPDVEDIIARINFIRAGASTKNPDIQQKLKTYYSQFSPVEKAANFAALDAVAQLLLGGEQAAVAPTFEDPLGIKITAKDGGGSEKVTSKQTKRSPMAPKVQEPRPSGVPITAGEARVPRGVNKMLILLSPIQVDEILATNENFLIASGKIDEVARGIVNIASKQDLQFIRELVSNVRMDYDSETGLEHEPVVGRAMRRLVKKLDDAARSFMRSGISEGVKRRFTEVDVPLRSGKSVMFGSRSHVIDLEGRIADLVRIRSYQEKGSDSRATLGAAVKTLQSQLRAAHKMGGHDIDEHEKLPKKVRNPRTQEAEPIVEDE